MGQRASQDLDTPEDRTQADALGGQVPSSIFDLARPPMGEFSRIWASVAVSYAAPGLERSLLKVQKRGVVRLGG